MKKISIIIILLFSLGCSKDDGGDPNPTAATLIFPDNNQECNQGVDVAGTNRSTVTFRWSTTVNTDSYDVFIKNLNTQSTTSHSSLTNELPITIDKGTPYSWYVVSKKIDFIETAQSDTWKFYNAGDPITSYAPFPADLISPVMGSITTGITTQNLSWSGSDIDNDIVSYDVYFDTSNPPTMLEANTATTNIDVTVAAVNTYYWRVVTKDSQGNNSQSEVFEFRIE